MTNQRSAFIDGLRDGALMMIPVVLIMLIMSMGDQVNVLRKIDANLEAIATRLQDIDSDLVERNRALGLKDSERHSR